MATKEEILRAQAIDAIDRALIRQDTRWKQLHDTVELAADNVRDFRISHLEDASSDSAFPLWMSAILSVAIALIPLEAMLASGLSRTVTFSRNVLGRIKVDRDANLIVTDLRNWYRDNAGNLAAGSMTLNQAIKTFIENDTKTLNILSQMNASAASSTRRLVGTIAEAKTKPLFSSTDKLPTRNAEWHKNDSPAVIIKQAFYDWINAQQETEKYAVNALKLKVAEASKPDVKDIEAMIAALENQSQNIKYTGPDARLLLQRHIEACIWCTTYDFTPIKTQVRDMPQGTIYAGYYILDQKSSTFSDVYLPPPFGKKFWERMTDHFISDYKTGKTFKEVGDIDRAGTVEEPILYAKKPGDTGLDRFNPGTFKPELRLSFYFSYILRRKLIEKNQDMAKAVADSLPKP